MLLARSEELLGEVGDGQRDQDTHQPRQPVDLVVRDGAMSDFVAKVVSSA